MAFGEGRMRREDEWLRHSSVGKSMLNDIPTASGYGLIKLTQPIIEPAYLQSTEHVFGQLEGAV